MFVDFTEAHDGLMCPEGVLVVNGWCHFCKMETFECFCLRWAKRWEGKSLPLSQQRAVKG